MSSRAVSLLRLLIAVLVIGIVVVSVALARQLLAANTGVPRTELERAVFAAEEAVKANPNDSDARIKLAAAYLEQGSASSAIKQANDAIRLAPKDPTAYYIRGLAETKANSMQDAVRDLKKAAEMTGQQAGFYQDANVALAHALEKTGDTKGTKAALDRAIGYGPENALLLYERAQFGERQKDWYAASLDYAWSLEFVPNYQPAQEGLARMKREHAKLAKQAIDTIKSDARFNAPAGSHATTGGTQ